MSDQVDNAVDDETLEDPDERASRRTTEPSISYIDGVGLTEKELQVLKGDTDIANVVDRWSRSLSHQNTSSFDVFSRNSKWDGKQHMFSQFAKCVYAVENDDILSTLADVTEGLTFAKVRFEMNDVDQRDVWDQWAAEVDLDSRLREQFRELFKVSQVYVGLQWERRIYAVRDSAAPRPDKVGGKRGKGNRRRKKRFAVEVPTAMTIFDPTKIMPVGQFLFGKERFAYIASREEHQAFQRISSGDAADPVTRGMIERQYTPTREDMARCADVGVDHSMLWLLRPDAVYRHTLTKAQYEAWAAPRLRPVLPLLEIKAHLRASDRSALIGATNFIVVITKGTDKLPARAAEIENLKQQARVVARLPVLVGDHRLKVEIVAPSLDKTLTESRWQVIDSRLVFKALQSFQPIVQGGNSSGGVKDTSRIVAQGLESRRHQLMRSLERGVFRRVLDRNAGILDEFPGLVFSPRRITLDFSSDIMQAVLKLRDRGDISRETTLDEFDYDQDTEVLRRMRERDEYDDVFQSSTPHSSPTANPYGQQVNPTTGASPEGGRPAGATDEEPRAPRGSKQ